MFCQNQTKRALKVEAGEDLMKEQERPKPNDLDRKEIMKEGKRKLNLTMEYRIYKAN